MCKFRTKLRSAETEKLKKWIRDRITWVDENFEQLDHMVHKMTFVVEGKPDMIDYFGENESVAINDIIPERDGYTFIGWEDEGGQIVESEVVADQDHTYQARFLPDSEVTHGQYIALATESDVIVYNNYFRTYKINYKVVPEDAFDQGVVWSSSDERLATVDRFGNVRYTGTGEVTFTAKLKLGETRDFRLLITKDEYPPVTSVELEQDALELAQGEMAVLRYRTTPSPAKVNQVIYESEDKNVVTADEYGVLTAAGPGETKVRVIIHAPGEGGEDVELETFATVTVTGGESETESRTEAESESKDAAESTTTASSLGSGKTSKDNTMMWMILALVLILIPVVYKSVTNKRR
ncbi:MAG: Ig-like domain-containing protein [Lachnospiraceae bacterium]|nr:Ig-like domain-containing protein [Lachnospiraceae bacterium]